jgi:hypothetical protein
MKKVYCLPVKVVMLLMFLLGTAPIFAQIGTYEIKPNSTLDLKPYIAAMDMANFDEYRFQDARRLIEFESGVKVELLSGIELMVLNKTKRRFMNKPDNFIEPKSVFKLLNSGYIVQLFDTQLNNSPKKL